MVGFVRKHAYPAVLQRAVTAMGFAMNFYTFQEFLAVMLLLAVLMGTILVFAVVLILFQEGIRRAIFWAKTGVIRPGGFSPKSS
jgi:energy-converting hydrogenase Eha subunit E